MPCFARVCCVITEHVKITYITDLGLERGGVVGRGGVSREWWTDAVERYGWDVDVDSIVIESLSKHVDDRYNVFMRKNNEAWMDMRT